MKQLILSFLFIFFIQSASIAQYKLATISANWSSSKICVDRTILNFIIMIEMSTRNFEEQMKLAGAKVKVSEDYCIEAAEQFGAGSTFSAPAIIFTKCDNDKLIAYWYGDLDSPAIFLTVMEKLKDHYLGTEERVKYYGIEYLNNEYTFSFERYKKNNAMHEVMIIWKVQK
jgi:hypothetical protein